MRSCWPGRAQEGERLVEHVCLKRERERKQPRVHKRRVAARGRRATVPQKMQIRMVVYVQKYKNDSALLILQGFL